MSASTVSITANQGPTTRRRAVEKNISAGGSDLAAAATVTAAENKEARLTAGETAAAILRDAKKSPAQTQPRKSGPVRKSTKPRWVTVVSVLTKNLALLVVLLGFVQMIRWVVVNSGRPSDDFSVISGDFEGKFSEVEKFVKTTMKAMQVQVNAIDRKLDDGISSVRKEFDEKMDKKGNEVDLKLKALDVRSDAFEKFMDEFRTKSLLSKEEFGEFFEEFKKAKKNGGSDDSEVSVDEIKAFAREIVEREIERHAADGLGMVDYALASGGGRVLRHSEPYGFVKVAAGGVWLMNRNRVSNEAEKMIRPSFGEPGQCFALKGGSGFVEIRLRTAIVPEAVTLEHVAKSVAYDRSSAPKHCRVSGWMQGQDSTDLEISNAKMFLLTEFTYDLEKSNAQTFKVEPAAFNLVNTVRLDFTSNHGSATHTCIYRLRVHGHEPSPVPAMEILI
ncbi:Spindle pole body protein, contains UNC-84 domain [Handroanthus impetiginosus]|uniref:Spindle pole body protein, contains UNC-84 domain n=1 Tax=Handroanthus impetiginosus TaxID=429701 RepID=A0A2G9HI27_9LAMI|nr:Spindle pole body protein, contains UNC-84 domain [Handroanthus impetiginosus]